MAFVCALSVLLSTFVVLVTLTIGAGTGFSVFPMIWIENRSMRHRIAGFIRDALFEIYFISGVQVARVDLKAGH